MFRGGDTVPHDALEPTKNPVGFAGYLTIGWTPNGHYGPAIDNNPLRSGVEWINRFEVFEGSPGAVSNEAATFISATTGVNWQVWKQLRLQADVAVQKYNNRAVAENAGAVREYVELWGQVSM